MASRLLEYSSWKLIASKIEKFLRDTLHLRGQENNDIIGYSMELLLFYLAIGTLLFFIILGIDLIRGQRLLKSLKEYPVSENTGEIKVSVIIPARNEERNIEEALQSILHQDYENLEIIIVNDRSTDSTGEIIDRMAKSNQNERRIMRFPLL